MTAACLFFPTSSQVWPFCTPSLSLGPLGNALSALLYEDDVDETDDEKTEFRYGKLSEEAKRHALEATDTRR
jgi:hypothetical protein